MKEMKQRLKKQKDIYRISEFGTYRSDYYLVRKVDKQKWEKMKQRHYSTFRAIFIGGVCLFILGVIFMMFFVKGSNDEGRTVFNDFRFNHDLCTFFFELFILLTIGTIMFSLFWYIIVTNTANRTRLFMKVHNKDYYLLLICKFDVEDWDEKYSKYPKLMYDARIQWFTFEP